MLKEVPRREESRVFHWEWGQRVRRGHSRKSAAELGMRPGDWTWGDGGRKEDLKLTFLFPWSE